MYIYPSLFKAFGGNWFSGKKVVVNSTEAVRALDWYVDAESKYAPPAVRSGRHRHASQGTLGPLHRRAFIGGCADESGEVESHRQVRVRALADRQARAIWNWGMTDSTALTDKQKRATRLFIMWASCAETQARTSWKFAGPAKRSDEPDVALEGTGIPGDDQGHRRPC